MSTTQNQTRVWQQYIGELLLRLYLANIESRWIMSEYQYADLADYFAKPVIPPHRLDPLSPREDWPDGLAYLIDMLESEADTITTPFEAWWRCRTTFIGVRLGMQSGL